jgi:hypothetical protein
MAIKVEWTISIEGLDACFQADHQVHIPRRVLRRNLALSFYSGPDPIEIERHSRYHWWI